MRTALTLLVLAACGDPPPLSIKFKLTTGPDQQCMASNMQPAQSCSDVALPCPSHLGIRIVSPSDPTRAFVSMCEPITGRPDLCSIAGINLPDGIKVQEQTLEVEVTVYPDSELVPLGGNCPTDPKFDAKGLPVSAAGIGEPTPAVGGSAYYHPGDSETIVALGCTDQAALAACIADDAIAVNATVNDFDLGFSVSTGDAAQLELFVGEPHASPEHPSEFILSPSATRPLALSAPQQPGWTATLSMADQLALDLIDSVCVEVLDFSTVIRPTLACKGYTPGDRTLGFTGVRIAGPTLDQILKAAGFADIPMNGIVIGVVIDSNLRPVSGVKVTLSNATNAGSVAYLSADRTKTIIGGPTTSNGIFISTDAPYGSVFSTTSMLQMVSGFGGIVDGKVTVVVLQFPNPQGN